MNTLRERFESKYVPVPYSGCWLWDGAVNRDGYGQIKDERDRIVSAHRISHELHIGLIPEGLFVLHECDVPACVNPDHLWLGTQAENMQDCARKGRSRTGRLTLADVRAIRRSGESNEEIAIRYGVHRLTIHDVRLRRTWAHVE